MRVATTWVTNALAIRAAWAGDVDVTETATRLLWPTGVALTESSSVDGVSFRFSCLITASATGIVDDQACAVERVGHGNPGAVQQR